MPPHDIVAARQWESIIVVEVVAADHVHEPGKRLRNQAAEGCASGLAAIGNEEFRLANLAKYFHQRLLWLDIIPANQPIPSPMTNEGRFGEIISQPFILRVHLENNRRVRVLNPIGLDDIYRTIL